MTVDFLDEGEAGAGFKLWSLVDLSGKGKVGDETTHKVKLVLEPVGPDGKPTPIRSSVLEHAASETLRRNYGPSRTGSLRK